MGRALLVYTSKNNSLSKNDSITLESGSLRYIDTCTKEFKSKRELVDSYKYRDRTKKIENGELKVYNIRNNSYKESIPILLNDLIPIYLNDNYFDNIFSEIERARKLLFRSKNKVFMSKFLSSNIFDDTLKVDVKLSKPEYKFALKKEIPILEKEEEHYVNAKDLFEFSLNEEKLGTMKPVFEECLEMWKKQIKKMGDEALYYYSRNLRILINYYYRKLKEEKKISNLKVRSKLVEVVLYNYNNQNETQMTKINMTPKIKLKDKAIRE